MRSIFIIIVLFTMISVGHAQRPSRTISNDDMGAGVKVTVEIEFGKKSKGCSKFGVCKVSASAKEGLGNAVLTYSAKSNTLTISVDAAKLKQGQPDKMDYFVGKKYVSMDEDFEIPNWLKEKLDAPNLKIIPAGNHPLKREGYNFLLEVSL